MPKLEALAVIIREARQERGSIAAARRVIAACRALALSEGEIIGVLTALDYCDADGNPYRFYAERWPLAPRA